MMTGLMSGYHGCTCHGCICHGCTSLFTNAQLLPLDIPQVRQQLRQEVPALAFFLEKLGVDAVACAVSWLNLFVC